MKKRYIILSAAVLLLSCVIATTYTVADSPVQTETPSTTVTETTSLPTTQEAKTTEPPKIAPETPQIKPKQTYLNVSLSNSKQDVVRRLCKKYGVPFDLVIAMMKVESNFNEKVISSTNDYGVMQINQVNHSNLRKQLGVTDFLDFEQNVESGCYLLSGLIKRYGDTSAALMCYNGGEGGAKKLWAQGIYTTEYTRKVTKARNSLTWKE